MERKSEPKTLIYAPPHYEGNMGDRIVTKVVLKYFPEATYLYDNVLNYISRNNSCNKLLFIPRWKCSDALIKRFFNRYSRFILIGMDTLDGYYGTQESITKLRIAKIIALNGGESWVINFSWNSEKPKSDLLQVLTEAQEAGVKFIARDSNSAQRLTKLGITTRTIHDLAFLTLEVHESARIESQINSQFPEYAILAPCRTLGHLEKQIEGFVRIIPYLRQRGMEPVLFTSVYHARKGDLEIARRINSLLVRNSEREVRIFQDENQFLEIIQNTRFVLTGRMHVAILSFVNLVPAFILEYQGKVSGLLEDLNLVGLSTSKPQISEADVDFLMAHESEYRDVLARNIPKFKDELRNLINEISIK